ncbi:MAG: response regulator transcription factor [Verrucomicrobiae bacterium]|nr:response regulator transcription factor [Verrucomicrobiae bacterium]
MSETAKRGVYLVDDHQLVREWLSHLISQEPDLAVCGESENTDNALAGIREKHPDVAVVDISLKGASGLELIKQLSADAEGPLIIVLSMHDEPIYAERAFRSGARGYLIKQDTARNVLTAIRTVLEGGLYVSEAIKSSLAQKHFSPKTGAPRGTVALLSDRELEVFRLLGGGQSTAQIAEALHVSAKTVQTYCSRIKEKLNLGTSSELLREAFHWTGQKPD